MVATPPGPIEALPEAVDPTYRLQLRGIWRFMVEQPPSFWLVCLYMFFEYVRPQEIYESLKGLPIPSWTIILCLLAFLVEGNGVRGWKLADSLLVVFSLVVLASSVTAYQPSQSYGNLSLYFSWLVIYWLITSIVNTERRFMVFMLLYLVFCIKMTQHGIRGWAESGFGFRSWGVTCAPSWFRNSGECGIQMGMLFPVSLFFTLALRTYWERWKKYAFVFILPAGSVITIVASSSRGALLALAAVALWLALISKKRVKAVSSLLVLAAVVWIVLPAEQKERFSTMGEDQTSVSRTTYWTHGLEILREHPVLGIGYDNWLPYYHEYYNPEGELPHNIFIQAGAELGYVGLFAFALLILGTLVTNYRTRKLAVRVPGSRGRFLSAMAYGFDGALIAYLVAGFFVTVLYYPFFWINLAMTVALANVAEYELGRLRQAGPVRRHGALSPHPSGRGIRQVAPFRPGHATP